MLTLLVMFQFLGGASVSGGGGGGTGVYTQVHHQYFAAG